MLPGASASLGPSAAWAALACWPATPGLCLGLGMHAVVAEEVRARYASLRLRAYAACCTLLAAGTLQR